MCAFSVVGRLVLGTELVPGAVIVERDRLLQIVRGTASAGLPKPVIQADIVSPGLIDLQVNGGFGYDVGPDPNALRALAAKLPSTGVTAFLPTLISSPENLYGPLMEAFRAACITGDSPAGARMLGLHLEGPFLSPRRPGAHPVDVIESASSTLLDTLLHSESMRLMTIAPERDGGIDRIQRLRDRGVTVSLGHTDATYDELVAGVDAGATMVTHLYNAMSPLHHRAPGAVGAALADERVTVGLIADGVHSHSASVRLAIRAKGIDRIALVTDMMSAAGMPPGRYQLGSRSVTVDGESARLEDGTLAGSIVTMDQAIRNVVSWTSCSIGEVLHMATAVPARILGCGSIGRIAPGNDADLVLFDRDLRVQGTIIGGRMVDA